MKVLIILAFTACVCVSASIVKTDMQDMEKVCDDCKQLINSVKDYIDSPATMNASIAYFEGYLCGTPSAIESYYTTCAQMVDTMVPQFLQIITDAMDPHSLCTTMYMCQTEGPIADLRWLLDKLMKLVHKLKEDRQGK